MIVAILHAYVPPDAPHDEQDTLVQVEAISDALRAQGHEPRRVELTIDLAAASKTLKDLKPDYVFNLVESVDGAGRLIYLAPALLDHLRIPYTGNATEAMFVTSNKIVSKNVLMSHDIKTANWLDARGDGREIFKKGRYIVKAAWEHASVGLDEENIIEADAPEQLIEAIARFATKAPGDWYAERFIEGREFNISVMNDGAGSRVLPPAEIQFNDFAPGKPKIVGYRAKWIEHSFEYGNTPRSFDFPPVDGDLLDNLITISKKCWSAFGLNGYARVDFRVDESGVPWVLEINANPCISPDAGFTAAAERAGMSYNNLIKTIVSNLNKP